MLWNMKSFRLTIRNVNLSIEFDGNTKDYCFRLTIRNVNYQDL